MSYPKYNEIQIPLLNEINRRNGKTRPSDLDQRGKDVYEVLADYFLLTDEERSESITENGKARSKWKNMVRWARNDLRKLDFLNGSIRGVWVITAKGEKYLNTFKEEEASKGNIPADYQISPERFSLLKERALEIGELGEKHVLDYERRILIQSNREDLAQKIKQISKINVAAGYDILSFDVAGKEKYIEVKTSQGIQTGFELTKNEREKATEFGERYWIYKVVSVESDPQIIKFQNPSKMIDEGKLVLIPTSWQVILGEQS